MKNEDGSSLHYNREERLNMPSAPDLTLRVRKGPFRGNRGLLILLFDILFICLVAFIFRQFLFRPSYEADALGYRMVLNGYSVSDGILAVVRIERKGRTSPQAGGNVEILLKAGQNEKILSEKMTQTGLDASASFAFDPAVERIEAEIRIGDRVTRLVRDLPIRVD